MANTLYKYTAETIIGVAVYRPYQTHRAGYVTEVLTCDDDGQPKLVAVRWLTGGVEYNVDSFDLNDMQALIDDHTRKLATHQRTMMDIEALKREQQLATQAEEADQSSTGPGHHGLLRQDTDLSSLTTPPPSE